MFLTDEDMHGLPEDLGEAFVVGERIMRERLKAKVEELSDGTRPDHLTLEYMNNVIALARHCGITQIAAWENARPSQHTWQEYRHFAAEVDACTMAMRLAAVRRAKEYSVQLDAAAKKKLSHLLTQMREAVEKLEISLAKKDKLYKRINALQDEIDRERTGFHAFGALVIEAADNAGEAATSLEPVTRMIERLGAALGLAKRQEPPPSQLPSPKERKRITGPKKSGFDKALDEEIPF